MIQMTALMLAAQMLAALPAAAPPTADEVARGVLKTYLAAWDRADARALARQYAADGDLVGPDGALAVGPKEVGAFYTAAFKRGYAGSRGTFTLIKARLLGAGVLAVDGEWDITGAPASRTAPPWRPRRASPPQFSWTTTAHGK